MKNRVDPNRIVYTIEENFKDELSKPKLRNLDRGFADVKLMKRLDRMGAKFIIRVRKNTGIVVEGYVGKLKMC